MYKPRGDRSPYAAMKASLEAAYDRDIEERDALFQALNAEVPPPTRVSVLRLDLTLRSLSRAGYNSRERPALLARSCAASVTLWHDPRPSKAQRA